MERRKAGTSDQVQTFVTVAFVTIVGFYLFTEHRAHLFGALPYLLFLACPLMHIFMHRDHGTNRRQRGGGGH